MRLAPSDANLPMQGDTALLRMMGFWALSAAMVNMIIGGIFALPAALAKTVGTAAPISYLLGALTVIPIGLCFTAAGSRVTATRGPYTYVGKVFGPFAGFVISVLIWVSNVASNGGVAATLTDQQVAPLSPAFGSSISRYRILDPDLCGADMVDSLSHCFSPCY